MKTHVCVCGQEHPLVPHPSKTDRLVAYCPAKYGSAVCEVGKPADESTIFGSLLALPGVGSSVAENLKQRGFDSWVSILRGLSSFEGQSRLLEVPGIGDGTLKKIGTFLMEAVPSMALIVTGTGRCGTRYTSKMLSSAGVPVSFEQTVNLQGPWNTAERLLGGESRREASWQAAPFLDKGIFRKVSVVHLVRRPSLVIKSFLRMNFFSENTNYRPWADFARNALPEMDEYSDPLNLTVLYYLEWNRMIETRSLGCRDYIFHRIEDDDEVLLEALDVDSGGRKLFSDKTDNIRGKEPVKFELGDVEENLADALLDIAAEYGYKDV